MKKTACIITGGTLSEDVLYKRMERPEETVFIVVDGALELTDRIQLEPDYIVGDFDTVNAEVLKKYPEHIILRHRPEKDQTDTELAVEKALDCGCETIEIFGAVGSRWDHSLANIFLLQQLLEREVTATIYDENNKLYLKKSSFAITKERQYGVYVSLIPLTDCVENVTLNGFKYSVEQTAFYRKSTLGVSNEIIKETATVDFERGIFIVVESKDK